MTNTPMTFEQWYATNFANTNDPYHKRGFENAWQASQAQQAQTISDLERMLGKVTFENECLSESKIARNEWLYKAKQQWGADTNVSFDVVWNEALALKAQIPELVEALERAKDMVGHEDNIAFIDAAIAKVKGK